MSEHHEQVDPVAARLDLALWRRFLRFTIPYRWYFLALAFGALLVASIDITLPLLTGGIIDAARSGDGSNKLFQYGLLFVGISGCLSIVIFCFIWTAGQIATGMGHDIRKASFEHLQKLDFSFFDKHNVGWLMARLTSDCDRLSSLIGWMFLDFVWSISLVSAIVGAMLFLDWHTALAVLASFPLLLVVSLLFQKKILVSSRDIRKINSQLTSEFNEAITGMRTTRTLGRESENQQAFETHTASMFEASYRNAVLGAMYFPMMLLAVSVGEALALTAGGHRALGGIISVGTMVSFMYFAKLLPEPVRESSRQLAELLGAQAAGERVVQLLDTEPTIVDSEVVQQRMSEHAEAERSQPGLAADGYPARIESIAFQDVSFEYIPDEPVLHDFNLAVSAGQTVALVGATGGGKSTIVNLLCRFYEPTQGRIEINGLDYRERSLHWLHQQLGMVLQQPYLFNATVRENIRYGNLDATDEQVIEAARLVHAHDFIVELEAGYDFNVGQAGNKLSSGQRQLISFARAVLADPQVLIMDEATASVDTEVEQQIQQALHDVLVGRIAFIIAHRLSTIRRADLIVVIDEGRIVEQGSHQSLLAKRGRYFELYTNQFMREHEAEAIETA